MNGFRFFRLAPLLAVLLAGLGCAYPISSTLRQEARKDLTFARVQENPEAWRGAIVIWGGTIQRTDNQSTGTAVTVLKFPLDWRGKPKTWDEPEGRFILTSPQFLDPANFQRGRPLVVAGEITGAQVRPLGGASYRYPVLAVRQIHLWRVPPVYHFHTFEFWPNWYDYQPYSGYYYGPYNYVPYGAPYNWWDMEPYEWPYGPEWRARGEFRERGEFRGPEEGGERGERGEGGEHGGRR